MDPHRELIIIGDRVLIRPDESLDRMKHGLYLPQTVAEGDKIHSGTVIKVGPGMPMADPTAVMDEPWKATSQRETRYVPLQACPGDHAIFLRSTAVEIEFEDTKYVIVPHAGLLLLVRDHVQDALNRLADERT